MSLELSAAPPCTPVSQPAPGTDDLTAVAPRDYQQVVAWQAAMDLVAASYRLTRRLPVSERAGLCAAVHAATTTVAARIATAVVPARGLADSRRAVGRRQSIADAIGALHESETLLTLLVRLGYVTADDLAPAMSLAERVRVELRCGGARMRAAPPAHDLRPSRTAG